MTDDGVFGAVPESEVELTEGEPSVEPDATELRRHMAEMLEIERQLRVENRALAAENRALRNPPSAAPESVELGEIAPPRGSRPNVDYRAPFAGGIGDLPNDLVVEAPRVSRDLLKRLVKEEVKAQLPRQRGIAVHVPDEGRAVVPSEEVVAKTYSALVAAVVELASRAARVPLDDGIWSLGIGDEANQLLLQVAAAAPRRPKAQIRSRSL